MAIRCERDGGWGGHGGPTHLDPLPFAPGEIRDDLPAEVEAYLLATGFFSAVGGASEGEAAESVAAPPAKSLPEAPRTKPARGATK